MTARSPALLTVALLAAGLTAAAGGRTAAASPAVDPEEVGMRAIRVLRDADGLPQNTVHAITLDQEGYLWIGTQDGAAFYNGRSWTAVDMPNRTRSNYVRAILAGTDGSVWFGTQAAGLCRLKDGRWSILSTDRSGLPTQRINALLETRNPDGSAVVWVGTHGMGLARLDGERWTIFDTSSGLPANRVWALHEERDRDGHATLWVGTERGLCCLRPGETRFVTEPGFPRGSVNSFAETSRPDGSTTLWVGTYGNGVFSCTGGTWSVTTTEQGLPSGHITSLVADAPGDGEGSLWIGTDGGGLAHLGGGRVTTIGTANGLPSDAVYSLLRTSASSGTSALWVGTRNGGLARLRDGEWRSFHPIEASPSLPVLSLLESRAADGAPVIWMGTDGGGLAMLDRGRWTVYDSRSGRLASDIVQCLLETSDESGGRVLWVGTRNGGLARLSRGAWKTFSAKTGELPNDLVQCLLETVEKDGSRTLWVGTRGGLVTYSKGRWRVYGTTSGLPSNSVLALLETVNRDGGATLWVGTAGGLVRVEDGRWRTYGTSAGLLNAAVQCLFVTTGRDGHRTLWAGTDGGGLSRLDLDGASERWTTLTDATEPALPNNVVYKILEDAGRRIYVLTNKGVARLTPRAGSSGEDDGFDVFTFTVEDGLPRNQCNRGAGMVDSRGRIWVGTVGGAAVLDPSLIEEDRTPKRLIVQGTVADGTPTPLRPGATLSYRGGRVVFELALLSYFREGDTRYRTRLVGLDTEPSDWQRDAKKEYRTLPSGSYRFAAWGRDYAGNVTGPVEIAFVVRPAPWMSWWAMTIGVVLLGLLVFAGVRLRLVSHRRREAELTNLVDARTRELREANELLAELSYLDPVTGIGNRRRFEERLDVEWRRAARTRLPLSLVMIDIDWFKAFNDAHGHQQGDQCLKAVAAALADGLPRAGDSVARYGGEEFGVILPATDRQGAVKVAEQLRGRVEGLGIPHGTSTAARVVTISCGVATFVPTEDVVADELIRLADESLYRAKQAGRNRVKAEHGEPHSSISRPASEPASDPSTKPPSSTP